MIGGDTSTPPIWRTVPTEFRLHATSRPFGVSLGGYAERTPWKSVRRHLGEVFYEEFVASAFYLCEGQRRL